MTQEELQKRLDESPNEQEKLVAVLQALHGEMQQLNTRLQMLTINVSDLVPQKKNP